jgi:hypothetical protein
MTDENLNEKVSVRVTAVRYVYDEGYVACDDTPDQANGFRVDVVNHDLDHPLEIKRFDTSGEHTHRQACQDAFTFAGNLQRYTNAVSIGSALPATWQI